jgi:hypothetical protein
LEPKWTSKQHNSPNVDGNPIKYWVQLQSKYPDLSSFEIDVLSIPASTCECERMFSELGDLLAPRRHKIGSQLLAALQCIRAWIAAGLKLPTAATSRLSDHDLEQLYNLAAWEQPSDSGKFSLSTASSTTSRVIRIAASYSFNVPSRAWLTSSQNRRLVHLITSIH